MAKAKRTKLRKESAETVDAQQIEQGISAHETKEDEQIAYHEPEVKEEDNDEADDPPAGEQKPKRKRRRKSKAATGDDEGLEETHVTSTGIRSSSIPSPASGGDVSR